MCVTTTHWATHISTECSRGGSAICDGYCTLHGEECTCSCHTDVDVPQTFEGVQAWHDNQHDVVTRITGSHVETLIRLSHDEIARLVREHGDQWKGVRGAEFKSHVSSKGHAYIYVEFS